MSAAFEVVAEVDVRPLPPLLLSKNGPRVHWATRNKQFQYYKSMAGWQLKDQCGTQPRQYDALTMLTTWYFALGPEPDDDNITARVAAIRDAAQAVGLVANDKHITNAAPVFERVKRGDERCVVKFVRIKE